ncbi:hypothetical protein [Streptomyces sp. NPDC127040]|uniref:hypothetical protein n=1 Tax=Streptomyces sp. NPDC127040 TaxID=3347116 RepID=UPI00364EFACD
MEDRSTATTGSTYGTHVDRSTLVSRIARWMAYENPNAPVNDITLEDQARHVSWTHLHHAAGRGRVNPEACDALTETVLAAMPKPLPGDIRSEYGRRILDADASIIRREQAVAHALQAATLSDQAGDPDYAAGHRADAARMRKAMAS